MRRYLNLITGKGVMADLDTWLVYHLPRTRVRITGTVTERFDLRQQEPERKVQSQVALETTADPSGYHRIELRKSKLSDNTFALELTEDGRLVSTETKSVGRLGQVVRNVFSFVTSIVGVAGRLALLSTGAAPTGFMEKAEPDGKDPVLTRYQEDHPQRAARRKRAAEALEKVRGKVVSLEESLVDAQDPDERKRIREHLADLAVASSELLEETARLDVHFQAWKASLEQEITADLAFTFDLSELPKAEEVVEWEALPTDEQLGAFAPAYRGLDLVLARRDVEPLPAGGISEDPGTAADGVFFRQARPVELSLYVVRDNELVLMSKKVELVMDEECRLCFVEHGETRWSEASAEIELWPTGGLKTLKNSRASEAAAATGALKELPGDVKAALAQANEIIDEQQKLQLQGIEQRIAELEKKKSLVEKEIALGGVIDTRASTEEMTRLQSEIDLLKKQKDLGVARRELQQVEVGSAVQLETEILKLRTALEQAQVDRLEVEQELRRLASQKPGE